MYLISKHVKGSGRVGWLHDANGKKYDATKQRQDPIVVTWTRSAAHAKVYQASDDAHYICEMIWGDRNPPDVWVNEVSKSEIESGELNVA